MQNYKKSKNPFENPPDNMDDIIDYVIQMNIVTVNKIQAYFNLTHIGALSAMYYLLSHNYVESLDYVSGKWKVLKEVKKGKSE